MEQRAPPGMLRTLRGRDNRPIKGLQISGDGVPAGVLCLVRSILTARQWQTVRLPSSRDVGSPLSGVAGRIMALLTVFLIVLLFRSLTAVIIAADAESPPYRALLPLVMHNAPAMAGSLDVPSNSVVVRVEDEGGNPIEGAQIVGLYTDSDGQTISVSRVTDVNGEAIFLTSPYPIIFEVQFPVGIVPCPGSPPRVEVDPGETYVKFVGCRL
ncbi:MAG: hypothetical protein D6791_11045 [Chloroflexi bacterium]|nr:MAG: hypothetical protein D6791_11045 [Chloroflexota bacterium]